MKIVCPRCGGSGMVTDERAAIELSGTRTGTGLVHEPCDTCAENGWLLDVAGFV